MVIMFETYKAVLTSGIVQWLDRGPETSDPTTVLVTVLGEDSPPQDHFVGERHVWEFTLHVIGETYCFGGLIDALRKEPGFRSAIPEFGNGAVTTLTVVYDGMPGWSSWDHITAHFDLRLVGFEQREIGAFS